ncbi:MAG: PAS domain-containing hybrid sensor histidine kinase/response regulator [Nevskia sp.]|nr:PAS domain-containing hybrid sensor histidine kinase/response regulator [Nevskia sp.]
MLQAWSLFAVSAAYAALLFGIAYYGDRRVERGHAPARKPWIYSLALGVYCTSWTFYGAVGRAVESGWDFLPIYLGPMLVFGLGYRLVARIVEISKRHNITSIADFISARYGRHQQLGMLVAAIALVGVLPYIALQLKAVSVSFAVLTGPEAGGRLPDSALPMAAMLALFAILFGTRQVVSSENHHGMVLAIAFESAVKLVAFVALGLYATYGLAHGFGPAYRHALALPQVAGPVGDRGWQLGFLTQTVLAMSAVLCLPRQFHVAVVENTAPADLRAARWLFPLYLGLISVFVLPIAAAGLDAFPRGDVIGDSFVLSLPLSGGREGLALFAYLGGFSAATSMVIVATIALSTMLCNEVVVPLLLRLSPQGLARRQDLSGLLKTIRRVAIVVIVALAYLYYRLFIGPGTLAHIGLLSFSAVLMFAPGLVGGVLWRGGSYGGTLAGLAAGFAVWVYTLLLPTVLGPAGDSALLLHGPFGFSWLRPQNLFGVTGLDPLTHGTLWSLAVNLACYVGMPMFAAPGLHERLQGVRFLGGAEGGSPPYSEQPTPRGNATVGDLQELLQRFFEPGRVRGFLGEYAGSLGVAPPAANERAEPGLVRYTERLLVGALGASSARLILASTLRGRDMQPEDVVRLLDETSLAIQFNREMLRAALEHLPQGISVVDRELRLVAWNRRYIELLDYPEGLIVVGRRIEEVFRFNAQRGLLGGGEGDTGEMIERRLAHMRAGHAYTRERELPGGTVIETRGNPMPGGGFVTSYFDITAYKNTQRQLQEINETLESRVVERTRELTALNAALSDAGFAAERANTAKTRFLAAASHDLVQPLNAARLFLSSLDRHGLPSSSGALINQVENSLSAAESLLASLLDISRLDAGAQEARAEHFELARVIEPLAAEFRVLAETRGLRLRTVPSRAVVFSDPRLLRRVLQNFLSNAVRYTRSGRILLGCRRVHGALRIEVWDSGPGIPPDKQREIFEEFRRLDTQDAGGERGLGLGLAIAERIAQRLGHPLSLRSWPGKGSVFGITVPLGEAARIAPPPRPAIRRSSDRVAGATVLCLDNEPAVLAGMVALLGNWGCRVLGMRDRAEALEATGQDAPDLLLVDYHLDGGVNGIAVAEELRKLWDTDVPVLVITADHTQGAREAAAAHGFTLLPKPVKPAALRALMGRLLSARERAVRLAG